MGSTPVFWREFEEIEVLPEGFTEPVQVTPVLFYGFPHTSELGYGLLFERPRDGQPMTEKAFHAGVSMLYIGCCVAPHDLFRFWRAVELVRFCTQVTPGLIQLHLVDLVSRECWRTLEDGNSAWTLERIHGGMETLDGIMKAPVPIWLVDFLVKFWSKDPYGGHPRCFIQELRAGTIQWEDRFTQIGVIAPEEEDRRSSAWGVIQPRYRTIMQKIRACTEQIIVPVDMARFLSDQRDALVALVDAGAEAEHGIPMVAALAYIVSQRTKPSILGEVALMGGVHPMVLARYNDDRETHRIHQVAAWVYKRLRHGKLFDEQELRALRESIPALLERYFPWGSHERQFRVFIDHICQDT